MRNARLPNSGEALPRRASAGRSSRKISYRSQEFGVACRYRKAGGKWLVLLHGLQSNKEIFDPLFNAAELKKYSLLALDLIGFGGSCKPDDFSYDVSDQTEMVLLAANRMGIREMSVVGHSLGGMIATLALEKAPARIESIVSLEGNLTKGDCGESAKTVEVPFEAFRKIYPRRLREIETSPDSTGALRYRSLRKTPDYSFYKTSKSIVEWSASGRLLDIFENSPQRKLLIIGGNSDYSSIPKGPTIKIARIARAGHFMLIERPQEVISAMAGFLRG